MLDLLLEGGAFTWLDNHNSPSMSQLDIFLVPLDWGLRSLGHDFGVHEKVIFGGFERGSELFIRHEGFEDTQFDVIRYI